MIAKVDDDDFCLINQFKWQSEPHGRTYRCFRHRKNSDDQSLPNKIFMHRFIMSPKKGQIIDHIDGDGLNNQRLNLRFCTHSQNIMNGPSRLGSSSKYLGVSWHALNKKWKVQIQHKGKNNHIGTYESEEEAALAYNVCASFMFGAFARLNAI